MKIGRYLNLSRMPFFDFFGTAPLGVIFGIPGGSMALVELGIEGSLVANLCEVCCQNKTTSGEPRSR